MNNHSWHTGNEQSSGHALGPIRVPPAARRLAFAPVRLHGERSSDADETDKTAEREAQEQGEGGTVLPTGALATTPRTHTATAVRA